MSQSTPVWSRYVLNVKEQALDSAWLAVRSEQASRFLAYGCTRVFTRYQRLDINENCF